MRVRMIGKGDGEQLWQLVMAYLKEVYAAGGDFPPTLNNAPPSPCSPSKAPRSAIRVW